MNTATNDAINLIRAISDVIEETAREAGPLGAPSGVIYAALMGHGITLDMYQAMIAAMQAAGRITLRGDLILAGAH